MSKKRPTRPKREEYKDENTNEFQNQENFLNENKSKKTNNLVYIVITVLLLIVVGVGTYFFSTITTRSQIKNLDEQVETLNNTIKNKNETINDMSDEIESTTVKEVVPTTSLQRIEGSNIPEFYLIEGDFIAPKTLNIPTLI
jgi:predicted PurR-regulated permease PerM